MQIEALDVPITSDDNGVLRIGGTRVTLDIVVAAFEQGCTPEEIAQDYPTLHFADVYAALTYYLQHRERILAYLDERRDEAEEVRTLVENRREMSGLRERLRVRRQA